MNENNQPKEEKCENSKNNCSEDFTLYGEFIPSFHHWISSENLKKRTKKLQKKIKK
ncbi:MAG: hypothetical protein M0R40_02185 [Firmicutes bacterium]|nr:hypothetical protein [Bacillota bacterium]